MLNIRFLSDVSYLHVFVAGLAYWVMGSIWYMAVFSKPWAAGVAKWGIKMGEKPDSGTMMRKMIVSLICNIGGAFFLAWFIRNEYAYNAIYGAKIGFTGGIIAVMAFTTGDNWLGKPMSTWLVDATYHVAGLTVCGVILGAWH